MNILVIDSLLFFVVGVFNVLNVFDVQGVFIDIYYVE